MKTNQKIDFNLNQMKKEIVKKVNQREQESELPLLINDILMKKKIRKSINVSGIILFNNRNKIKFYFRKYQKIKKLKTIKRRIQLKKIQKQYEIINLEFQK